MSLELSPERHRSPSASPWSRTTVVARWMAPSVARRASGGGRDGRGPDARPLRWRGAQRSQRPQGDRAGGAGGTHRSSIRLWAGDRGLGGTDRLPARIAGGPGDHHGAVRAAASIGRDGGAPDRLGSSHTKACLIGTYRSGGYTPYPD